MDDKHINKTFIHHAPENGIPLDYSFLEATEKWTNEIPLSQREYAFRRDETIKFTRDSLFFADIFPKNPNDTERKKNQSPIPVELEPFFRDYVLTIINSDHSELLRMKNQKDPKLPKRFGIDFFKNAHASIKQAPATLAYYEKELYNDPAFQRFAAEHYWEAEFDRRCHILKETVLKCPPGQRISQLGHILKFLDTQIGTHAEFAARAQNMPDESGVTFLRNFPVKLFDLCRSPKLKNGKRSHTYTFENMSIKTSETDGENRRPLSYVFPMVRGISTAKKQRKGNEKTEPTEEKTNLVNMLIVAREQYLTFLSSKTKESEFYEQAHKLDSYLKSSTITYDPDTLRPIVMEIARQYYIDILNRKDYPLVVLQKPVEPDVTTAFLEGIICSLANNFVFYNREEMKRLFLKDEDILVAAFPHNITMLINDYKMESPELFDPLFKKYVGQESADYWDKQPALTSIESLVASYYKCLFQLEYPSIPDSSGSAVNNNHCEFEKKHNAYLQLCALVCEEWNELVQKDKPLVMQYISNPDVIFPFMCTYFHRILFTIKLYSDYRYAIHLAEKCYVQYHSEMKNSR